MDVTVPRVGVLAPDDRGLQDLIRAAGGEPVLLALPEARPEGGVALIREWVADAVEIDCSWRNLDAILIRADSSEALAGLALAAIRLDLPAVLANRLEDPLSIALAALGLAPLDGEFVETALDLARAGEPGARSLIESFPLANALRAGCSIGGGPELLVHLLALSREADVSGFDQMLRVLAPEIPTLASPDSSWFQKHGAAGLLSHLGDSLHDVPTVTGDLKESLPQAPPAPPDHTGSRIVFVRGRASGVEGVCRLPAGVTEAAGECRVFDSEEDAVEVVGRRDIEAGFVVVRGCGPRGGPGALRLERLCEALDEADPLDRISVLTDGVAPDRARGAWVSLFTPEAAAGGIIARLGDGDTLRLDFESGAIRTGVRAREMESREPRGNSTLSGYGYAARYAGSALSAFEGAGFG